MKELPPTLLLLTVNRDTPLTPARRQCQRIFKTWCHRLLFSTSSSELPSIDIWKCQRFFKTWCHRLLFETSSSELPSIGISPKTCHDRCRSVEFSFRQRSPNFVPCHSSKTFLYQVASINNTVTPRDDPYLPTYPPVLYQPFGKDFCVPSSVHE